MFKTNVKSFVSLRTVQPPIATAELRRIAELFPDAGFEFKLDPSFEPESGSPDLHHTATFAILQRFKSREFGRSRRGCAHVQRSDGKQILQADGIG